MNIILFTTEQAELLISQQEGRHRLAPVQLTDGRYFLYSDVLNEPLFEGKLDGIEYEESTFESIENLLPVVEEEI
jgi:hypothetical protein